MYNKIANANYVFYDKISDIQKFLDKYMVLSSYLKKLRDHKTRRNKAKYNRNKRIYDSTNILTSDTENTSLYVKKKDGTKLPFAFSYAQMININGKITIITRDIKEHGSLLDDIDQWYERKGLKSIKGFTSVIWFHNLSYDFQFLLNNTQISETLSRKKHDVIYAQDENRCFLYKDSYSLLGVSLDSATKDYNVEHKKLVGQLNYSLKRLPITRVTEEEIAYFINDVQGLAEIIKILMNTDGYGCSKGKFIGYSKKFPNTKTSLVRNYISDVIVDNGLEKYRKKLIDSLFTSAEMYKLLKVSYQGGYTHAFGYLKGQIVKNVTSYDKTSDYPYQIVTKKYPMSKFEKVNLKRFYNDWKSSFENSAYIIKATLEDVQANSFVTIIPFKKFEKSMINGLEDNGKMYKCDKVTITCTELDFMKICELYDIEKIKFHEVYRADKDYLPYWIIKAVFEFYKKKTTLKDVPGMEVMYQYYKQLLNSIYGCMVQDPCKASFSFSNGEWSSVVATEKEDVEKKVNDNKKSNVYQWGVWVTAYARYELVNVAQMIKDTDLVYCDTDSLKFKISEEYTLLFDKLNKEMTDDNKRVASELHKLYPDISYDDFIPKNKKGKIKELGLWDHEGDYLYFKTTGAKRYVYIQVNKDGKNVLHVTCCGIAKDKMSYQLILQSGLEFEKSTDPENKGYIIKTKDIKKVFDKFDQGFHVEAKNDENGNSITGKSVHTYFDTTNENYITAAKITDYQGNKQTIKCENYITLFPAEFSFNANRDEIDFLIAERNR